MLASTALVLMMTVPGLALFYAGMVRKKNILATMMQSFTITCIVTIVWMVAGYSLAFTAGTAYMGDLSRFMLNGIADHIGKGRHQAFVLAREQGRRDDATTIPETVYMMFQMTFAIITPALIAGAFADRMKFSAMCMFMVLWSLLVYSPIAHWVWAPAAGRCTAGGLRRRHGRAHQRRRRRAGVRAGAGQAARLRHRQHGAVQPGLRGDRRLAAVGRLVRLQRRSAVAPNGRAGMAMAVTQIATAAAALGWMFAEWIAKGKPSVLGACRARWRVWWPSRRPRASCCPAPRSSLASPPGWSASGPPRAQAYAGL